MQGQPVPVPGCQGRWLRADATSRLELREAIGGRRQPGREAAEMAIAQREAALLGAVSRPHPKPTGWKIQLHCLPGTLQIDRPRVAKFLVSIEKWGWSTSAWWWQRRSRARASGRSLGWTWVPVKTAPSGDLLQGIGVSSVTTPQNAVLDHTFSIGPADYRFTSLTLEPSNFVLTYEPMNIVATKTVLGGGLSTLNMTDDLGGIYSSYLTVAKWSVDDGQKVRVQSLYFEGLPNPDANTFPLHVNGIGEIKAPYRFEVALR